MGRMQRRLTWPLEIGSMPQDWTSVHAGPGVKATVAKVWVLLRTKIQDVAHS
jgi:hypothetical protein